jgi:alginate O-acetyltransferase complex protein AlgI
VNALDGAAGLLGFTLQIYFDFSAYSDIAIGSARLFGFRFPENFDWPYLSRTPREFWTRWHMTLSRWIRDYLFTPAAFATRANPFLSHIVLVAVMALVGLWHGAAWTFVLWGVWHGVLLVVTDLVAPRRDHPKWDARAVAGVVVTFALVSAGWLLFRATSLRQAVDIFEAMVTLRGGFAPGVLRVNGILLVFIYFVGLVGAQLLRPWFDAFMTRPTGPSLWVRVARPLIYAAMILSIIILGQEAQSFVYFQF